MVTTIVGIRGIQQRNVTQLTILSFPLYSLQLFYVLESGDYRDIISWTTDGQSFEITNPTVFASKVLPEIFREAKFSSFHRKVSERDAFN